MARCRYLLLSTFLNGKMSGPGRMRQIDYLLQLPSTLTSDEEKVCVFCALYSPSVGSFCLGLITLFTLKEIIIVTSLMEPTICKNQGLPRQ